MGLDLVSGTAGVLGACSTGGIPALSGCVALGKGYLWRIGAGLHYKPQAPVSGQDGGGWTHPSVLRWYSASGLKKPMPVIIVGERNGNPLQCFCLENPVDGGAWWAAVYGVAQSQTPLKRLSNPRLYCLVFTLKENIVPL